MRTINCLLIFIGLISQEAFSQNAIQNADKSVVWIVVKLPGDSGYGTGTGFMVAPEIIATNHHVIKGAVKMVAVTPNRTGEGKSHPIELIWDSPKSDLALLKAPGLNLPPLVLSEKLPPKGHNVTAIGYPGVADDVVDFKGVESTLTQGIVGRIIDSPVIDGGPNINMIQHSAAINSGNSGGPLVDNCGRVVGINEAKAKGRIEKDGKGFAINQSDGISLALAVSALTNGLKVSNIVYNTSDIDCKAEQPLSLASNSIATWAQIIGISIALLLAGGAFFFSIKKKEVIRETFTQFQRRKPENTHVTPAQHAGSKSWRLKGEYPDGRSINIALTSSMFNHGPLFIGRDSNSCKVLIDDPSASRKHAVLELSSDSLKISDPGSTNGTWLDREKIGPRPIQMRYGQILTIGKVRLKLEGGL
jgi:hypothetical protein